MSQLVKNAEGTTFQLAMLTVAGVGEVQCVALVGADGQPITAWPLPTGAATEDGQVAIASAVATLAQALGSGMSVTNFPASQTVSGTVNVGNFPATQPVSVAALPSVAVNNFPATQPVSLASVPLPPNAATSADVQAVRDRLPATPHTQPLTDTQLRAAPVEVVPNQAEDSPAIPGAPGFPILGVRHDSDYPTADDGDWTWLKIDEEGRLKVATKPASVPPTVGDLTKGGDAVFCDVRRASNVVYHMRNAGTVTMTAGTFSFEASLDSTNGSDGTWFGVQAARSNANIAATTTSASNIAVGAGDTYAWEASVNGYRWFRVRCSTAVTNNSIARWTLQPGSYATEPLPVNQVSSVTANIGTCGGSIYPDTAAPLAGGASFTGTSRDIGSSGGYRTFAANVFADQDGTLYIDKSTDNATWRPAAQVAVTASVPAQVYAFITTRYNRVRFVNGSVAQTAFLLTSTMQRI